MWKSVSNTEREREREKKRKICFHLACMKRELFFDFIAKTSESFLRKKFVSDDHDACASLSFSGGLHKVHGKIKYTYYGRMPFQFFPFRT